MIHARHRKAIASSLREACPTKNNKTTKILDFQKIFDKKL